MILTRRQNLPSARAIRDFLEEVNGVRLPIIANINRLRDRKLKIRWGNSDSVPSELDTNYNSPEFIRLLSFKKSLSDLLLKNETHAVEFHRSGEPKNYPVITRTSLSLSAGKGMNVVHNLEEFQENFTRWWTPFIPVEYEMRIHFVGGKLIRAFIKRFSLEDSQEEKYPIRVANNGYHYSLVNLEGKREDGKYQKLFQLEEKLMEISEIKDGKFFALDIGWDSVKKEYLVFEGNSAPSLANNPNTSSIYSSFLAQEVL